MTRFLPFLMVMLISLVVTSSFSSASALTGPVAIISNSIDMPTAERTASILKGMGFEVRIFSPSEFDDAIKYGQFVIVLGGHKAPEGIGQISSKFLSTEEKAKLEGKNYAYYFIRRGPEKKPVVIVAGNDRFGTYRAANTFLIRGLKELSDFMTSPGIVVVAMASPAGD